MHGWLLWGGVVMKLMCVSPQKILKAVLLVPSALSNASNAGIMFKMGIPMTLYIITQNEKWLRKAILPMAIDEDLITESSLEMARLSFNHVRVKSAMPGNIKDAEIKKYKAPTLLIAAKRDVLFPGEKIIARARTLFPDLRTYLIPDSGHMCSLSTEKNKNILNLIQDFLAG